MKRHIYTLPPLGSAPLAVLASQPSRRVEVAEDGSATPEGIVLFYSQDGYAQGYTHSPARQPVVLGDTVANAKGKGPWVGLPVQMDAGGTVQLRAATTLFKGTSAGATPTNIEVVEYD